MTRKIIKDKSPEYLQILAKVRENQELLFKLNNQLQTPESTLELLAQITNSPIPKSVMINLPFYSDYGANIKFGENVFVNTGVQFTDVGGITLEDGVLIGPRTNLITASHPLAPAQRHDLEIAPIVIKKNAWLGANVTVLPGVTIGENAVVAAGAVVTKDVPANTVVAGVPAKVLKQLLDSEA
ncbi:DapH/DapD/GlmU-related protein [Psittacicella gerlachiana]|uniref:Acetyltransferase n=1 Tax=Psittacicella gerlachiana TaxID=2028574 RepID=A0A3A1YBH9_9GAMM|nr:DapH/DapD/GlmU-related protein [Psittacicella gerlachiana]RIY34528.1 acetyltransferase [Psittacicella gerlachiana]